MSFAVTAAVTAFVGGAYLASQQKSPNLPAPPAPTPPPQASQAPDATSTVNNFKGGAGMGGSPGVASTFLTGPGGIDPNSLTLGRTTLLGG